MTPARRTGLGFHENPYSCTAGQAVPDAPSDPSGSAWGVQTLTLGNANFKPF